MAALVLRVRYLAVALCALALALTRSSDATPTSLVGINYGRVGSDLPPPQAALPLLQDLGIARVRVYNADPAVLGAFGNTGAELVVGVPDECLDGVANRAGAAAWINRFLKPYLPATNVAVLAVGNEVLTGNSTARMRALLPAMQSLHGAMTDLGLDRKILVTTAHNLGILDVSFPPSAATFRANLLQYISPILDFHAYAGSPFLVNAYPYFAYSGDAKHVPLEYALLEPTFAGVADPGSGLRYPNLLVAQVDAVYHAIGAAGSKASGVEVHVSETGWPSSGEANETAATPQNAARYNSNAFRLLDQARGTPLRPAVPLRAYVFALYNENMKPGLASERFYGLYRPDGTPAYQLAYRPQRDNSTNYGAAGDGHGYYDYSAASREPTKGRWRWAQAGVAGAVAALMVAVY